MADRPILFSAPMVRALLECRKTQTRRILKPQPHFYNVWQDEDTKEWFQSGYGEAGDDPIHIRIAVGDRLYVREHWRTESNYYDDLSPSEMGGEETVIYAADADWSLNKTVGRHRQAMHMPRWASRLTLIVTDVRVERLQDISEEDALAEGIAEVTSEIASSDKSLRFWKRYRDGGWNGYVDSPTASYASLWTEINGPGSWEANPFVVAYTFTVQYGNIDNLGRAAPWTQSAPQSAADASPASYNPERDYRAVRPATPRIQRYLRLSQARRAGAETDGEGMMPITDADGRTVKAGDLITFSYGMPGVRVEAPVVEINGELFAITIGHKPDKCKLKDLRKHVGEFWKLTRPA